MSGSGYHIQVGLKRESSAKEFSSFDKPDHAKEAKDFITKAETDLSKTAKKAGKGIFAAAKSVKDNVDKS